MLFKIIEKCFVSLDIQSRHELWEVMFAIVSKRQANSISIKEIGERRNKRANYRDCHRTAFPKFEYLKKLPIFDYLTDDFRLLERMPHNGQNFHRQSPHDRNTRLVNLIQISPVAGNLMVKDVLLTSDHAKLIRAWKKTMPSPVFQITSERGLQLC